MRKKLPLIIGIVLALVAAYLIKIYTDQQRQLVIDDARKRIEKIQTEQVPVLVAAKNLPKGALLDRDSVGVTIIPTQHVQPQAATSLDRVAGMMTAVDLSKGEQITLNKLVSGKEAAAAAVSTLSMATPIGKRAVTIAIDGISAVGGMVMPGDYVDLVAMVNVPTTNAQGKQVTQASVVPLFQNVLVLAIGRNIAAPQVEAPGGRYAKKETKSAESSPAITFALKPQEASLLAFVQEQGRIRLSLRSPADAKIEQVQTANWETLFRYIMPPEVLEAARAKQEKEKQEENKEKQPEKPKEPEPGTYVEIYRGLNKEKMVFSK